MVVRVMCIRCSDVIVHHELVPGHVVVVTMMGINCAVTTKFIGRRVDGATAGDSSWSMRRWLVMVAVAIERIQGAIIARCHNRNVEKRIFVMLLICGETMVMMMVVIVVMEIVVVVMLLLLLQAVFVVF